MPKITSFKPNDSFGLLYLLLATKNRLTQITKNYGKPGKLPGNYFQGPSNHIQ